MWTLGRPDPEGTVAERPLIPDALPTPGDAPVELFRDDDLLAVAKPAGWLTHEDGQGVRPDVVSALGERLGVHQRLDVGTSGVLVFSRSKAGARRLQHGFESHAVRKRYVAVVEGSLPTSKGVFDAPVAGRAAETRYEVQARGKDWTLVEVQPVTGRTHQIRVHFAGAGCPIRGDARYGDALDPRAPRLLLHCAQVVLGEDRFDAPPPPELARYLGGDARRGLRADGGTTCFRELNGAADGCPGWAVDRYGDWLRMQHDADADAGPLPDARGVYVVDALRDRSRGEQTAPMLRGESAPAPLAVVERGVRYQVDLGAALSTGLFLDQRVQRAWLGANAGGMRVLNTFAHAGGYSIAAGLAGAETVSIDLSRAWLDRIPRQLVDNGVDPARHDCIYGDVFDWVRRLARRGERFDLVILDPPGTSVGKKKRRWSAARDYDALVELAAPLVRPGGRLWTTTNVRRLGPRRFAGMVRRGLPDGARLERVCPPPIDFPSDGSAPVKTLVWRL